MTRYTITGEHYRDGSVSLLSGYEEGPCLHCGAAAPEHDEGCPLGPPSLTLIAAEPRMADAILEAIEQGEMPEVEADGWQIMGTVVL